MQEREQGTERREQNGENEPWVKEKGQCSVNRAEQNAAYHQKKVLPEGTSCSKMTAMKFCLPFHSYFMSLLHAMLSSEPMQNSEPVSPTREQNCRSWDQVEKIILQENEYQEEQLLAMMSYS